jgi:bifunctional non-homologous end joining protein LigD
MAIGTGNKNSAFSGKLVARKSETRTPKNTQKGKRILPSVRSGRNEKLASFIKPMLAQIHEDPFDSAEWLFEIKWDGYRAVAEITNGEVKLYSRNGLSFLSLYPRVAQALSKIREEAVLDGEIVVFNQNNKPDFQKLQQYSGDHAFPIVYYVFDCLSYKGKSLVNLPLLERKKIAKKIIPKSSVIRYSDHVEKNGKDFFQNVIKMDLEGMIAKRANSVYHVGKRTADWLKIKNHNTQEAIIVGYTPPKGSRTLIGALVLAIMDKGKLRYIGHTGTGFTNQMLRELHQKLQPLVKEASPLTEKVPLHSKVTWVEPVLVCNVKYTEITVDGILRHPVFQGLRIDKQASEANVIDRKVVSPQTSRQTVVARSASANETRTLKVNGHELTLTNQQKIYWPGEKITKGNLIEYYQAVHSYILPHLKNRPQSLKRTPNGITNPGFYQKDAGNAPEWIQTVALRAESADRTIDYIICNDRATLYYLNNLGCIELNAWNSRISKPDHPDYMVIDLDPSDTNTFDQVIDTALLVHEILTTCGAPSYCKTSGASGLHVFVPMHARYTYEEVLEFAEAVVKRTEQRLPFTTCERSLSKRKGRIYLDYLQNRKGQTVASVYSVRPKPGAPVSTPLEWKEVKHGLRPAQFHMFNTVERLQKKGDLFSAVLKETVDLRKCIKSLKA